MSNFHQAVKVILENEGGDRFVNHPDDPGGATKYGISLRFLQDIQPEATATQVASMTEAQAITLYRNFFWLSVYDDIDDFEIAMRVFDHHVNAGKRAAAKVLQRALIATGQRVKVDGVIGPVTVAATNAADNGLLYALRAERAGFYRSLASARPHLKTFIQGWLRRGYS